MCGEIGERIVPITKCLHRKMTIIFARKVCTSQCMASDSYHRDHDRGGMGG